MSFFGPDIRNGVPVGLGSVAGFGRRAFTPAVLFAQGEAGAWYDPSDRSTLFQDSAGTTPVTAVEQAVGLALDKSRGLVLGPELVTNGDFSGGTTGWTSQISGTIAVVAGELEVTGDGTNVARCSAAITCVVGKTYYASALMRTGTISAGGIRMLVSPNANLNSPVLVSSTLTAASLTLASGYFVATATTMYVGVTSQTTMSGTYYADNISIRELSGAHLIQPSASSRPVLRARYNLLTYSEDFSNAAWAKAGSSTVTGTNTLNFPNTNEAISQSRTMYAVPGVSATFSVVLSGTGTITIGIARQAGGTYEQTVTQITLSATPTRYSVARALVNSGHDGFVGFITRASSSGDTATTVTATQADLRFTNDTYLPYQRIAAATDYDTVGFPVYLAFDGSDDSMYTGGNLDLSATDKVTLFAGVTKLSDAARGMVVELSATAGTNTGSFFVDAPSLGSPVAENYGAGLYQGIPLRRIYPFVAPVSNVLTTQFNKTGATEAAQIGLRVDGSTSTTATVNSGLDSGNFGSYPLYVGRRGNSSLPFNGRLYGLTVVGTVVSDALIVQAERWNAQKQGRAL